MAATGRIQRRLALAIVLTALIPVLMAIWLAETTVRQTAARFFMPDIGTHLDRSLDVYQDFARTVKALMNQEATAIALRPGLRKAVDAHDAAATEQELKAAFAEHPSLVTLSARDASGKTIASVSRQAPLDPERENKLEVRRSFAAAPAREDDDDAEVAELVAVFAANKARFDQRDEMSQFLDQYKQVERRRESDEKSYVLAFAVLLGITILAAIGVGTLLARGVSRRIAAMARATKLVAAGDLRIRVSEKGGDEIADLARAFNSMLSEVELSRGRLEYLQRISAWQEMARRLAHEIKNPLTPIQLAVQEIHRRSAGSADPEYKKLVDTTLEIVEDEVGTLRRLVSEFSDFARLPQAKLESADLVEFLREQRQQLEVRDEEPREPGDGSEELRAIWQADVPIDLEWRLPEGRAEVLMDRHMLRRVLINLLRNAAQAVSQNSEKRGTVRVELGRQGDYWNLDIDDTGSGIAAELRETVFDPYVTTKMDGTGLGLAIVKKIVIEHGGTVVADDSPLGGARIRVRLPAQGTRAARAALELRDQKPPASARHKTVSAA